MSSGDLQQRLERLGEQLVTDIEAWERRTRGDRAKAIEQVGKAVGHVVKAASRAAEREERRQERKRKREERKARRRAGSPAAGVVFLIAAAVCAYLGVTNHAQWWLVFVALGLGLSGAGQLSRGAKTKSLEAPKQPEPVRAPLAAPSEVDVLCDQLLADFEAAPDAVRSFVSEPKKTVATLRATLTSLAKRRAQLLADDAAGRLRDVQQQREALQSRLDATADVEARARLIEARTSLDSQVAALKQLQAIAERVDGEYTSLLVHLQELRTRVALARSSSSDLQLNGVQASVQRLNDELAAISEALETVRRDDLSPITNIETGSTKQPVKVRT